MRNLITIRRYEPRDKNKVIELFQLNTPKYFAIAEETDLINYLETEIELYYVLIYNSKIIGCGGINFANNKTIGKISWDIFHPAYQGKYLGTTLLHYRIEKLQLINTIQKITVRTSQKVYQFYEKQGFQLLEITKDYWATGFDLYYMEYIKTNNAF